MRRGTNWEQNCVLSGVISRDVPWILSRFFDLVAFPLRLRTESHLCWTATPHTSAITCSAGPGISSPRRRNLCCHPGHGVGPKRNPVHRSELLRTLDVHVIGPAICPTRPAEGDHLGLVTFLHFVACSQNISSASMVGKLTISAIISIIYYFGAELVRATLDRLSVRRGAKFSHYVGDIAQATANLWQGGTK